MVRRIKVKATDLGKGGLHRFWIIDYRIRLKQGAVWPVNKHRKSKRCLIHFQGRVCDYVEVHDVEKINWEFEVIEGGTRGLRFDEDLGYRSASLASVTRTGSRIRTGVLACVVRG